MQTGELLRQMLDYNEWGDRLTLESLKSRSEDESTALRYFVHVLIAEREWLLRLTQNKDSSGYNFWPEFNFAECEILMNETHKAYRDFVSQSTEDQLDGFVGYKNSKGVEYRTKRRDVLLHVITHSAYHRGQVALTQRAGGDAPAYTDYIAFVREMDAR